MFAFKNQNLIVKLNLILVGTVIIVMVGCSIFLSHILEIKTEKEIANQAFLMIETMNSVRSYTSNQIQPELASRLATATNFIPETVPAYSATEVFEGLRKQPQYQNFFYKEATLNPTNPRDKADEFEAKITQNFRNNQELSELSGFRTNNGQELYYIARPLAVNQASCLQCHSTPEKAPQNLINTYGSESGFGWQLNEIVASQIVSVPAQEVYRAAQFLQRRVLFVVAFFFGIVVILINLFLKKSIIEPIISMAKLSTKISTQELSADSNIQFDHDSADELGVLAKSLNRMIVSLQMAMNMINDDD